MAGFSYPANRVSSARGAQGGRLKVVGDELVFTPHVIDRLLMGKRWSVPLSEIEDAGVADRNVAQPFSGGGRRRLELSLSGGRTQLFVIRDPEARARELLALRPG